MYAIRSYYDLHPLRQGEGVEQEVLGDEVAVVGDALASVEDLVEFLDDVREGGRVAHVGVFRLELLGEPFA